MWWTERDEIDWDWECEWVRVGGQDVEVERGKASESELMGEGESSGRGGW